MKKNSVVIFSWARYHMDTNGNHHFFCFLFSFFFMVGDFVILGNKDGEIFMPKKRTHSVLGQEWGILLMFSGQGGASGGK